MKEEWLNKKKRVRRKFTF